MLDLKFLVVLSPFEMLALYIFFLLSTRETQKLMKFELLNSE